jgi:hypothetical protein
LAPLASFVEIFLPVLIALLALTVAQVSLAVSVLPAVSAAEVSA